jgi:hypothetical protein
MTRQPDHDYHYPLETLSIFRIDGSTCADRNYANYALIACKLTLIINGNISMPITTGLNYWDAPHWLRLYSWYPFDTFVTEEKYNDEWRYADDGPMSAAWYSITLIERLPSHADWFRNLIDKLFTEQNAYFVTQSDRHRVRRFNIKPCDESQTFALMRKSRAIEYLQLRGISNEILIALESDPHGVGSFDFMVALFPKQNHPFGRRRPFINLIEGCDAGVTHITRYLYVEHNFKEICSYFPIVP